MPKAAYSVARHRKHKRLLKKAKGMVGGRSKQYRAASFSVLKAEIYATRDRRARKGEFRRLWIVRINGALSNFGLSYSRFIGGLKKANIELDRKTLSEMAINNAAAFAEIVEKAKAALV